MRHAVQIINLPEGCNVIKNSFTTYDPELSYSVENSLKYLEEDLLQITISNSILIDLGWYGNFETNEGSFKIYVIKNNDWDNPIRIESSKSQIEISRKIEMILLEFTNSK